MKTARQLKLKKRPLVQAISCILAATSFNGMAQGVEGSEEKIERVAVTGSRILREGAEAPSPVTIISGEDLLASGAISIGEALNDLPALANTFSLANAGADIGTAGLNLLDLRAMGTNRTLVLVDGKRHVASHSGTGSVDVNTIPTAWVERVEIITGGASAVYGADAVTGVVNFVLKKDINGFDFSLTKGYSDEGPYDNDKVTLSFGQDFADSRGNFGIFVSHSRQDGMNATDRAQTRNPNGSVRNPLNDEFTDGVFSGHDGIPDRVTLDNTGWYDDSTSGNFYTYDDDGAHWFIFNEDGSVRPQNLGTTYEWGRCSDCDVLDLQRYSELTPTFKSYNINLKANYDINDNLNVYGEGKFAKTEADSIGQPSFFEYGGGFAITRDNAYIDDSLLAVMDQFADAGYGDAITLHRFMEDSGRRKEEVEREQSRFVLGLEGTFGDDWDFDVYGLYGQTKGEEVNTGNTVVERLRHSVDAIKLDNGDIVCRDEAARRQGCVPTSLFGFGAVNDEAANWFNTTSISHTKIQQTVISGSVTNGDFIDLPAGSVGIAFGAEYRKEESDSNPDAFASTGATFLTALQEAHGDFDVTEVFFETTVPLLADMMLIESLSIDMAVRFADYNTIGDATSWKVGMDWSVNEQLRFRTTLSEAIRAPNIGELFGPINQTFYNVTDPCKEGEAQDPVRIANCAALGIPTDFQAIATVSSIEGLTGGNPLLSEETSDSFTAGLVYKPSFIDGFVFTADYWEIDIDDAIDTVSAQNILQKCVDSVGGVNNQFCDLVTRDGDHEIRLIRSITQNVAKQKAQGVDFEFGYDFAGFDGEFTTSLIGTYLVSRKEFPFQSEPEQFIEEDGTTGEADWQANVSVGFKKDQWHVSWHTRYLDAVSRFTTQDLARNPDPSNIMGYGSYFQTDVRAGYRFENGLTLEFGVDNVFDRDLPWGINGNGETSASYDNIGRMFYTSLSFSM
ncbi:MAG: iron complex outermembrane receptor protein [Alteromonadaceae bacterium]|jgi:iron complex outermembrane receptor protein